MRTLEQLNEIAKPFLRGNTLVLVNGGRLKLFAPTRHKKPFTAIVLSTAKNWLRHRGLSRFLGLAGTDERTLCQLILWYKGLPRLPGRVLKWWHENQPEFCAALDAIGYDDALSLNCVLCGELYTGLDWWSLDGVTGPCCSFGGCRERRQGASVSG